jgi:hypothetical protein
MAGLRDIDIVVGKKRHRIPFHAFKQENRMAHLFGKRRNRVLILLAACVLAGVLAWVFHPLQKTSGASALGSPENATRLHDIAAREKLPDQGEESATRDREQAEELASIMQWQHSGNPRK